MPRDKPASTKRRRAAASAAAPKAINLALQGGGSFGALSWGILDALLDDERIAIEGISATSAGAMNAVVYGYGYIKGGREGAKAALAAFWNSVSRSSTALGMFRPPKWQRELYDAWRKASPILDFFGRMNYSVSPYEFNPHNINPLKSALEECVDFDVLRRSAGPLKIFLSATNLHSGKIRIFEKAELTVDMVLASACLPLLFQAVEIEGEHYWDGGFMGNPALFPLMYNCESHDIVLVRVNPMHRVEVPRTIPEILNRMTEISFNSSLMREMRAVNFVTQLIDDGVVKRNALNRMFIHAITADDLTATLSIANTLDADWDFLMRLRDSGRRHAEEWVAANFDRLGEASTIDIAKQYL
jgi:NTE family protein